MCILALHICDIRQCCHLTNKNNNRPSLR